MLDVIKHNVQDIVNNSTQEIIIGVFKNMIHNHNEFCGCDYCIILSEYVKKKKYLSILNKRMNNYDYNFHDNENVVYDLNRLNEVREYISELKFKKNKLKTL